MTAHRTFNTEAGVRSLLRINQRLSTASAESEPKSDLAARIRQLAARETRDKIAARNAERLRGKAPSPAREREIPASPEQNAFPPSADLDQTIVTDSQWEESDSRSHHAAQDPIPSILVNRPRASHLNDTVMPSSSQDILATINRYKTSKKASVRSAFIDRQKTATRVSPISENSQAAQSNGKRKRLQIDVENSDEEFGRDTRPVDVKGKRAQKPQQQSKRPRFLEDDEDDATGRQLQSDLAWTSSAPIPSQRPVRTSPPVERRVSTQQTAQERPHPPILSRRKPVPQARKFWSEEEDQRLINLAEKHGCSWAAIKRHDEIWPEEDGGPKLSDRNQVQLKDRARNIVMRLLKSVAVSAVCEAFDITRY